MPLYIVTFGIAIARLTLVIYNPVQISKLETKIATKDKNIDHLFAKYISKALMKKLKRSTTHLPISCKSTWAPKPKLKQKFFADMAICERLIQTAYDHRLAPGALHHDALVSIVNHANQVATKSNLRHYA
jgi:hypothetical protein